MWWNTTELMSKLYTLLAVGLLASILGVGVFFTIQSESNRTQEWYMQGEQVKYVTDSLNVTLDTDEERYSVSMSDKGNVSRNIAESSFIDSRRGFAITAVHSLCRDVASKSFSTGNFNPVSSGENIGVNACVHYLNTGEKETMNMTSRKFSQLFNQTVAQKATITYFDNSTGQKELFEKCVIQGERDIEYTNFAPAE